jgi:hypothetical protein
MKRTQCLGLRLERSLGWILTRMRGYGLVVGWICGACFVDITFFFFISPRLFVLPLVHDAYEPSPSRPAITPPLVYPHIICISVYRRIIASPSLPRFIVHQSFPALFFFFTCTMVQVLVTLSQPTLPCCVFLLQLTISFLYFFSASVLSMFVFSCTHA